MLLRVVGRRLAGGSTARKWAHLISPAVHAALARQGHPTDGSSFGPEARTGPAGLLLKADVLRGGHKRAEAETPPQQQQRVAVPPRGAAPGAFTTVPLEGRSVEAARGSAHAKLSIPQSTVVVVCDTAAVAGAVCAESGVDFVHVAARVAALAVRVAPEANAWCDADGTVTECAHVDLELSSLGRTVVVRRADGRGAAEFAQALEAGAADASSAEEASARPATVAVEDLSRTGVVSFAPFVRPPAVCTFGIGAPTRSVAVSAAGVPVVRETIAVSLSHDARAVDDAAAARVAAEFQAIFERGLL